MMTEQEISALLRADDQPDEKVGGYSNQEISDLLQQDAPFDRDAVQESLQDKTGIVNPGANDTLPSEFQIPGGFEPEMQQAMQDQFGFNAEARVKQEQQQAEQQAFSLDQEQAQQEEMKQAEQDKLSARPLAIKVSDFPAAFNAQMFTLLGLPGDAWNGVVNMLDAQDVVGQTPLTGESMRDFGATIGANYKDEDVPNTAATKAGSYLAQGLQFMAPLVSWGRAGAAASVSGQTTIPKAALQQPVRPPITYTEQAFQKVSSNVAGIPTMAAQSMTAPFYSAPGKAWLADSAASVASGVGAFELGEQFGPTGEMIGGLGGGVLPQMAMSGSRAIADAGKKQFLSLSEIGARPKARDYMSTVSGKEDIAETMTQNQVETLAQAKLSAAQLTGDEHMLVLEKELAKEDPRVYDNLAKMKKETDQLAKQEMEKLGGNVRMEETQAYLKGRVDKLEYLLEERVTSAINRAKVALDPLSATKELQDVNAIVREQLEAAKVTYKNIEEAKWSKVESTVKTRIDNTLSQYKELLAEGDLYKSTDKADIPDFVKKLLGYNKITKKKGITTKNFIKGDYNEVESLLDLKQFRTRISSEIDKTESATQKRLLTRLREAMTKDMESAGGIEVKEAIAASKAVHDTFEGDIMNIIFKRDKFNKPLDENLTLNTLSTATKNGPKAAVQINKILKAAPETFDQLENLVKIQMANSSVLQKVDGFLRVNLKSAEKYIEANKQVLDLFPKVKENLDFAIGQEQRFQWTKGNADKRLENISKLTASKLQEGKKLPGQVLPEIMKSAYPELEMKRALSQSNKMGRRGIRNAVVTKLMSSSDMDADKLRNLWNDNFKVYSQAFSKYELSRFERILKTMELNKGLRDDQPTIGDILPQENLITSTAVRAMGLLLGHKVGQVTGSPLHATSKTMRYAEQFNRWLDSGKARNLLIRSIEDPELFKALNVNPQNLTNRQVSLLMSYQLTTSLNAAFDADIESPKSENSEQKTQPLPEE